MAIKYEVNGQGMVVKVTTEDDRDYQVVQKKLAGKPAWRTSRTSRWSALKKAVLEQEVGQWYLYEPFRDENELKLARNALFRFKTDVQLKNGLVGKTIRAAINTNDLSLAVLVMEP